MLNGLLFASILPLILTLVWYATLFNVQ
jgi:hypothetical protein